MHEILDKTGYFVKYIITLFGKHLDQAVGVGSSLELRVVKERLLLPPRRTNTYCIALYRILFAIATTNCAGVVPQIDRKCLWSVVLSEAGNDRRE
jgi:hypothetical protein